MLAFLSGGRQIGNSVLKWRSTRLKSSKTGSTKLRPSYTQRVSRIMVESRRNFDKQFSTTSKDGNPDSPGTSRIGNIFDLTPEQYAELQNPQVPRDFQYKTYTAPPGPEEDEPIFEPKLLDLRSVTELMVKNRHTAAIKKALSLIEPHRNVVKAGYPSHDPTLNADLRHELSECLTLLGLCYMNQDRRDEAIDASMAAAQLVPTGDKFSDVAHQLLLAGRFEDAILAAERSLELDPTGEVDALVTKASALWQLKRFDGHDILGLCDLALARDPYVTTALEIKAQYLAYHGKFNDALKMIDRAIAKDGDSFHLIQQKVQFLEQSNRLPLALTAVLKFFKEEPDSIEAHREAARLAILTEDWKLAVDHLKPVVETLNEGHADLAHALTQCGFLAEAEVALSAAIERGNTNSIAIPKTYSFSSLKRSLTMKRKARDTPRL